MFSKTMAQMCQVCLFRTDFFYYLKGLLQVKMGNMLLYLQSINYQRLCSV